MTDVARFDVTATGETMLRLSVPAGERLECADRLHTAAGGAESNVLSALASLGRRTGYVTGLPENALGRFIARELMGGGVDLEAVIWSTAGRLGTYFVELATQGGPRPTTVVYDRAGSCASALDAQSIDWSYVADSRILHLTGITPALSQNGRELTHELRSKARDQALPVSLDVNYRAQLWTHGEAQAVLVPLAREVELLFCSLRDAAQLFGLTGRPEDVVVRLADVTGAGAVVTSSGAGGATLWSEATGVIAAKARSVETIDRLGAGDALAAGVLDGWLDGDLESGLRRGVALSALAITQRGDIVITTRAELDQALTATAADVKR
jgi:2-dehydro-3-deoxygluconokinase